ncbi:LuxR C-terminal-related transcriptional regulator [Streptomyces sp. NPDC056160]|uniref:helix-turn-helix domain-containing protein n=1 Tax=Streptomyces sp. NPDC056160 TaxID=3345731 RepID=UPI0035DDAB6C
MPDEDEACRQEIVRSLQQLLTELDAITHLLRRLVNAYESQPGSSIHSAQTRGTPTRSEGTEKDPFTEMTGSFTERENQVFRLLLTGMSNRQIARNLGIAERTVKNNLHLIYRKLGVAGRTEAISRFIGPWAGTDSGSGSD